MDVLTRKRRIARLVVRRMAFGAVLVPAVSLGAFALAAASPFDPLDAYLGGAGDGYTEAARAQARVRLGFDESWGSAWLRWACGLLHGDLGFSRAYHQPVAEVLVQRLGWTALLGAAGALIAIFSAGALGVLAGTRQGGVVDRAISVVAVVLQAAPPFVLALGTVLLFALTFELFPASGATDPGEDPTAASVARHLVLPAVVLGLSQIPWLVLGLRESLVRAMAGDAVFGARARGLPRRIVELRHALPLAAAPFVSLIGSRTPELLMGAAVVEAVFGWPGLGGAAVDSARAVDFPLLAAVSVLSVVAVLVGNLLADVVILVIDPSVEADG